MCVCAHAGRHAGDAHAKLKGSVVESEREREREHMLLKSGRHGRERKESKTRF